MLLLMLCLLGSQVSHWLRVRPTSWQISLSQAHGPYQLLLFHRFPSPQAGPHGHLLPNCWRDLLFTPTLPCQECRFCPISPSNICIILVVLLLSCKTRIRPTPSDSVMNRLFTRYLHDRIFFCLSFRWSVRATHAGDIWTVHPDLFVDLKRIHALPSAYNKIMALTSSRPIRMHMLYVKWIRSW